jgi:Ni,Fe-hydrogenase I cytochrome b subunit
MGRRMTKISERDSRNHLIDTMRKQRVQLAKERNVSESVKISRTMSAQPLKTRTYMEGVKMMMILSKTKMKTQVEVNVISSAALYSAVWMLMCIMARNATRE